MNLKDLELGLNELVTASGLLVRSTSGLMVLPSDREYYEGEVYPENAGGIRASGKHLQESVGRVVRLQGTWTGTNIIDAEVVDQHDARLPEPSNRRSHPGVRAERVGPSDILDVVQVGEEIVLLLRNGTSTTSWTTKPIKIQVSHWKSETLEATRQALYDLPTLLKIGQNTTASGEIRLLVFVTHVTAELQHVLVDAPPEAVGLATLLQPAT